MTPREEDAAFLAAMGETAEAAALRLGIRVATLDRWCERNRPDIWERLVANGVDRPARIVAGHINYRSAS